MTSGRRGGKTQAQAERIVTAIREAGLVSVVLATRPGIDAPAAYQLEAIYREINRQYGWNVSHHEKELEGLL